MKRPLVVFAVIFSFGIFVASKIRIPFLGVYSAALILLLFSFLFAKKGFIYDIFLCTLIFFLAAALFKNHQILPKSHISKFISYKNDYLYAVKGIVDSRPSFKNNRTSFLFKAERIRINNLEYQISGDILIYLKGKKNLDYGEELLVKGKLYRPWGSYRNYLYNQGIFSVMHIEKGNFVVKLDQNKGFLLKRLAFWLKERTEGIIFKRVSPVAAGILDAMVLGEKRNVPLLINNSMTKSGTVHILVVSGFNVGLAAFIIILFLRLLRIPKRMRFYMAAPLLIVYCLMTGASTPVVRATIMSILFMFAYFIQREPEIYNSCALAGMVILWINPRQLFDIGFQLSFASVVSIVYLYPRMKTLFCAKALKKKYIKFMVDGSLISFSAWLGTMGFIAYYFKIISPVTVLANLFIVPLASLITLCGFSLILMEFICPILIPLFASSVELITALLLNINDLLIKLPGAYFYLSSR